MTILRILIIMLFMLSVQCFAANPDNGSYEKFQIGALHWNADNDAKTMNWNFPDQPQASLSEKPILASAFMPHFEIGSLNAQTQGSTTAGKKSGGNFMKRHKLHKYASIFTLPLFVAEVVIGEELDGKTRNESGGLRSAHSGVAAGMGVLFGIETYTGVVNLWKGPRGGGHGKKMFHGILMLAADAGIIGTIATAPGRDDVTGINKESSTHKAMAYTTLGITAFSYIYMLLTK